MSLPLKIGFFVPDTHTRSMPSDDTGHCTPLPASSDIDTTIPLPPHTITHDHPGSPRITYHYHNDYHHYYLYHHHYHYPYLSKT